MMAPLMSPLVFSSSVDIVESIDGGLRPSSDQTRRFVMCQFAPSRTSAVPRRRVPILSSNLILNSNYKFVQSLALSAPHIKQRTRQATNLRFIVVNWLCRETLETTMNSYLVLAREREELRPPTLRVCFEIRWSFEISINHFSKIN